MSFGLTKRTFSSSGAFNAIRNVTVIGGGLMGTGIAQVAAQTGHNVTLTDINPGILKKSRSHILANLAKVAKKLHHKLEEEEKFINDTKSRIKLTSDITDALQDCDLTVEAIIEDLETKQKLFNKVEQAAPKKTIFASNTSSLGIGDIAAATKRVDRFGGLHFFSPVPDTKLVEVVKTAYTSNETYKALINWGRAIGKVCVTCNDTPGFVVNRLLIPYAAEAINLLERGDSSAKDIDTAMKLGAGYPIGPLELADSVGIDVLYFILSSWHKKYPDKEMFKPPQTLVKLFKEGKLGVKTGEGFYKYA